LSTVATLTAATKSSVAVTSTTGLVTESQDTGGMRPAQTQSVSRKKCALKNFIVSPLFKLRKKAFIYLWVTVLLSLSSIITVKKD